MNPFLATDGYKTGHPWQYPQGTTLVYSNLTPRSNKYAPKGCEMIVSFGQQMVMRQIKEMFDNNFFFSGHRDLWNDEYKEKAKQGVCGEIKREYSLYLGTDFDVSKIEALWDLGYLPIRVKSLPEGTLVSMRVPVLTIVNTRPEFYWLTNFLETLISNLLWKPMTSASIAHQYRKNLMSWAEKTDKDNVAFVDFQGHDFSMRGLSGVDSVISSGLGHATSFLGSDSLPVIYGARQYYDETEGVVFSVNATEHSVMCAGGAGEGDELATFRYLMKQFPTGILSIVSDTWDLWKVLTIILPELKKEILARDGKIVIRPDSGDPVDIICGTVKGLQDFTKDYNSLEELLEDAEDSWDKGSCYFLYKDITYYINIGNEDICEYPDIYYNKITQFEKIEGKPSSKGVIELLWDIFGGTTNEQGYKVLDPHIGAIYGDSITLDRAEEICKRLEAKGFASTNIVLGIGSFTYQYNTRDTFGFAMKATYVELECDKCNGDGYTSEHDPNSFDGNGEHSCDGCPVQVQCEPCKTTGIISREIFKDPVTDDGIKKSAKGLLHVGDFREEGYILSDQVDWESEGSGALQTIFEDGKFFNEITLTEIRNKLKENV